MNRKPAPTYHGKCSLCGRPVSGGGDGVEIPADGEKVICVECRVFGPPKRPDNAPKEE